MNRKFLFAALLLAVQFPVVGQDLNPLDMRWTFGAHEPYTMYRRIGKKSTGSIDGNALWVKPWLDWFDASSPALMDSLGLNWLHCRFYKGMGWEVEKEDFPNVKRFVENCHAHGVHALAYVQAGTLYPEIMKAEIPDVMSWAQVGTNGAPNLYTRTQYFRYMPCINCREWEEYTKRMCTIALTEGGFDGIMFDNFFSFECYCPECEKSFSAYLESLPDREERFGFKDVSGISIPRYFGESYLTGEVKDPVIQAWIEWRFHNMAALLQRLTDHIHSVKSDAVVSANITIPRRMEMAAECGADVLQLAGILDLPVCQSERYPGVYDGKITSRIRDLKLSRDFGKVIVALCDSDAKMTPEQEKHYLLPLYEDLAFGGVPTDRTIISPKAVPGFVDRARLEKRRPELAAFNAFVRDNRASLEAPVYEPVRIFYPEAALKFSLATDKAVCAAEEILIRRHIPWGYMISTPEKPFEVPQGTEVIIVPGIRTLSDAQVEGLVKWAAAGGKLVMTGDAGRYTELNAQRLVNPLIPFVSSLRNVSVRAVEDAVSPASLRWTMSVGAPSDHGEALLNDLARVGYECPFTLKGCPETVAVDVRKAGESYILQFVNYDPVHPVKGIRITGSDGKTVKLPELVEYAFIMVR